MNILVFAKAFYPDIGGIESIAQILAFEFCKKGHSVRLITDSLGDSADDSRFGFKVIRRPSGWRLIRSWIWCDVVLHINLEVRRLWPLLFVYKPLVIGLQTWICGSDGRQTMFHKIKRCSLRVASKVIACSDSIRQGCWLQAVVIPNPYQSQLFRTIPGSTRSQAIVFLGRLVTDKGADLLLKAYAALDEPAWRLTLIGTGPELPALRRLSEELGICHSVSFLGPLRGEQLVEVLNQHELMVVPSSWHEPFGIVALEGLACGCIVLASDGGGLPEAVGKAGLLFKRSDLSDCVECLHLLIRNPSLRQSLRVSSEQHLLHHTEHRVAECYLSVLSTAARQR